VNFSKVNYSN